MDGGGWSRSSSHPLGMTTWAGVAGAEAPASPSEGQRGQGWMEPKLRPPPQKDNVGGGGWSRSSNTP